MVQASSLPATYCIRIRSREVHLNTNHILVRRGRFHWNMPSIFLLVHESERLFHSACTWSQWNNRSFEEALYNQSHYLSEMWSVRPEMISWNLHEVRTRLVFWQLLVVHAGGTQCLECSIVRTHCSWEISGSDHWHARQVLTKNIAYIVCCITGIFMNIPETRELCCKFRNICNFHAFVYIFTRAIPQEVYLPVVFGAAWFLRDHNLSSWRAIRS